ncbi:MAG: methylmalonyl-CoA mutase family protein [Candidatus Hydrothermae bacterium]|nr:methylmalonyl-CoA mutase family protein [Candidatus Hydrothermae bacterium]
MIVVFLIFIGYTLTGFAFYVPSAAERIDPTKVRAEGSLFANPRVEKTGDNVYTAYVLAQAFTFLPGEIRVPKGARVVFLVTSPDVQHGFYIHGTNINVQVIPGEVGKVGVPIRHLGDMETLFDQIPVEKMNTSMTINATAPVVLAFYLVLAERRGTDWTALRGTVQNDILKEFAARGNYIYPVDPSMRLAGDLIAFTTEHVPQWYPISISGYHYREAGATAVQEVAFTLADGIAYVEEVRRRGLDVDGFARRLSFFFAAHNDFFEEIAKFRAARKVWARIMKERFGAQDPRSWRLRFHTQTAGSTLTAQEPLNNLIRVAYQALAAVLGGTQSLHTNGYDEALALPSTEAARLALRTQQILAYETGIPTVADPLGGSWYLERLTRDLEEAVWEKLREIDHLGGAVACIRAGIFQKELEESAYRAQQAVDTGETVVVGVNRFQDPEARSSDVERLDVPDHIAREEQARLEAFRARRDRDALNRALDQLRDAARGTDNLMPPILEAVRQQATLGEIAGALRDVWGTYDGA